MQKDVGAYWGNLLPNSERKDRTTFCAAWFTMTLLQSLSGAKRAASGIQGKRISGTIFPSLSIFNPDENQ
ncbi:hypothetical protein GCM10007870_09430 [Gluconobacter kondonii]|uniref:Uncharacterized protein n=1 Tax=Gluconobacter kondonii TaxID=941463 RepID=A0ABQ5WPY1_9PROT|nr:hypothetical protein AA3266_0504 [Gluconobacter kondonii NBRC 3266]GLQ65359.1 hypothetical protein GCM10007870_09430 [Gluconobacter kondonii]